MWEREAVLCVEGSIVNDEYVEVGVFSGCCGRVLCVGGIGCSYRVELCG